MKVTLLQFFCLLLKKYVFSYIEKYFFVYLLKISSKDFNEHYQFAIWKMGTTDRTGDKAFQQNINQVCGAIKVAIHGA